MTSCFDIVGPIMVGPSSSHTAGAVRLGKFARAVADGTPKSVRIQLHGSFAKTYKRHGTDLALLGGLLGVDTDDTRIRDSYALAKAAGLDFSFEPTDLGEGYHANTAKFIMVDRHGYEKVVVGCSVGGGEIKIVELDDFPVEIDGKYPTLIDTHMDKPGVIHDITAVLMHYQVNIAAMRLFRQVKNTVAYMVIETDDDVPQSALDEISLLPAIIGVKYVQPI